MKILDDQMNRERVSNSAQIALIYVALRQQRSLNGLMRSACKPCQSWPVRPSTLCDPTRAVFGSYASHQA